MAKCKAMESNFYVDYCRGDRVRILKKNISDKLSAIEIAERYFEMYQRKGKEGIITVFTISCERGFPTQKIYDGYSL